MSTKKAEPVKKAEPDKKAEPVKKADAGEAKPKPAKSAAESWGEFPLELMDQWAQTPGSWAVSSDLSEAYAAWRKEHPDKAKDAD